ncbi:MAG: DnaK suppressor protein [Parcubacteria group bacterium Gr01-1014_107]|nr:MAG: DnaK suppressor protein [Parcubacteria group bacterium Gr01-1014_107]
MRENLDLEYFKKKLKEEEELLIEELKTVGRINPNNPEDWEAKPTEINIPAADPNEVADSYEAYDENAGVLNELELRLANVKKALKRIENGSYGTCEVDGETIDKERLEANPAASTCRRHMK